MTKPHIHCAVYTRKSSEEGLEQSFNSLEAQREACIAYISSQKHEGWVLAKDQYDDGGFSGGSMERPALKRLLSDISAGNVQTVIVYKVDRLTRSLADFAKIIEVFDSHNASFVSVTQQFNTTTSMGRLTLNVLLSFAQFERELTGERIRDKVAASKKKGMWMGGVVPLGYDCADHCLMIHQSEAETVCEIFRQYLRLGCVNKLKDYLNRKEIRSKTRISSAGRTSGGRTFSRGALYHLLNNRVYIGEIVHQRQSYPGQHEPIVPRQLWDQVAAQLEANNQAHRSKQAAGDVQKPHTIKLTADFQPLRRGGELRLVAPTNSSPEETPVPSLVKAIARARDWYERIVSGEVGTVGQLAQKTGLPSTYIKRILACALLSPQMTEIILSGKHRPNLKLQELLQNIPMDWREQNRISLLMCGLRDDGFCR